MISIPCPQYSWRYIIAKLLFKFQRKIANSIHRTRLGCDVCGTETENPPYPSRNYRGLCDECRNLDWKVEEETTEQVLEKGLTTKEKVIRKMKELGEDIEFAVK
jgi:hypothetical protein